MQPPSARPVILRFRPDSSGPFGTLYTDTSDFMRITSGDVIRLGDAHYLVARDEMERKFGLEDPKFWVKRCRWLEGDEPRILKLVFHETFTQRLGQVEISCYRSGHKEARILDLVRGDPRFMQGFTLPDAAGNLVRVLEVIRGQRLDDVIDRIEDDHETYFHTRYPALLEKYLGACAAIGFLHRHGEKHGDVRNDHVWVESDTGAFRWIDFDYGYDHQPSPFGLDIFGLGNVLLLLTGKGFHTVQDLIDRFDDLGLEPADFSLVFRHRLVNLQRLFPYIPDTLSRVLLHFSQGAEVFYETVDELLDDLGPCLAALGR